ncbi:diaminopimelate epimerase [Cardinium endosymbiont of Tipula unca]|uniref:diaminopimelate epimerase n=1 Tax=Cardinium endosymbiont of Tipula unca TaxID=3066216 RepID=UPI0030D09171
MQLNFVKYQATGNDFIFINNFENQNYVYDPFVTRQLCHRQFGIGADGIITIEKNKHCDFEMLHYNADGSRGGGLCGNGSRSAIHYAQQLGFIQEKTQFWAMDGLYTGYISSGLVYLKLQDVASIQPLQLGYFVDNGTRHYIEMVEDVHRVDMEAVGFPRRNMEPFKKEGVNLNFVQLSGNTMLLRTCECGLDSEPLSCGTGAVASALVAHAYYGVHSPVEVITKGGKLWIEFWRLPNGRFTNIYLVGEVNQSFHGVVDLSDLPAIT